MSIFSDIDSTILAVMSEDSAATYNGLVVDIIIDKDADVESEGGTYCKKTIASIDSKVVTESQRGDVIEWRGETFHVQSIQFDDDSLRILEVRKV